MAFSGALIDAIKQVAVRRAIEPAALLAVVEVECGGEPFEADGVTPRFLFERHVFYKQLAQATPGKLQTAVDRGLAIPKWSRTTQYRDLGSSAGRQSVLARARAVDTECANKSCSWGIGQIMGFHAGALGYGTATAMVAAITAGGLGAQIDCLVRFLQSKNLIARLNAHDWAGFARSYNGPAYAQNDYDTRMASAYARWKLKTSPVPPSDAEEDIPLGRTPVQNAEPRNAWTTPEGVATGVSAGTGVAATVTSARSEGPMAWAFAIVIVIAAGVGMYFLVKRMRANP